MKRCVRHNYFKAMSHITTDTYTFSWSSCTHTQCALNGQAQTHILAFPFKQAISIYICTLILIIYGLLQLVP